MRTSKRTIIYPGSSPPARCKKDGLDAGANQTLPLEKIEHLTLYVLQQNKKIAAQQKRIARLEKANR